ncbi:beta-lactamase-like protein [Cercophora newfieldiana]|uniref:Beta-lactamase-like protein n=1 Tax=Cercophora newfieldiana TaxID=92897 RepID=A0AA40CPR0_9PEZI|nr:beta-lactamase-like protein [Cercophora newfieldiana]
MATYPKVSALDGGHITLPERLFITDADPTKRATVPSLCFLIQHPSPSPISPDRTANLIFDLGVKRNITAYTPAQQAHIAQRQPVIVSPDCADSLRNGGFDPSTDIDMVILSHVHWDHVGTPGDFPNATFAVGAGTLDLLANGAGYLYPKELFNHDELPADRTVEFPALRDDGPRRTETPGDTRAVLPVEEGNWEWEKLGAFLNALDLLGDGSVWVVDSPGHLYGHVNLLVRTGDKKWVYLGGDCCHDPRILSQEKGIALYEDGRGGLRSVHVDTETASCTLEGIRKFVKEQEEQGVEVEVIMAHDGVWRVRNKERFWPGCL